MIGHSHYHYSIYNNIYQVTFIIKLTVNVNVILDRSTLAELRRTRVCLSDFEVLQTIGRGHFGEVHVSIKYEPINHYTCP